jgi:hypothetical protein
VQDLTLPMLTSVAYTLLIEGGPLLTSVSFPNLYVVDPACDISLSVRKLLLCSLHCSVLQGPMLQSISFPLLTTGYLRMSGLSQLTQWSPTWFPSWRRMRFLTLTNWPELVSVAGLSSFWCIERLWVIGMPGEHRRQACQQSARPVIQA